MHDPRLCVPFVFGGSLGARGAAAIFLQAASPGAATGAGSGLGDRIRTSPVAWVLAGLLLLAAAYFLVRLMELDVMNRETPNQEDPFLK